MKRRLPLTFKKSKKHFLDYQVRLSGGLRIILGIFSPGPPFSSLPHPHSDILRAGFRRRLMKFRVLEDSKGYYI
jgi:hypothetical protein